LSFLDGFSVSFLVWLAASAAAAAAAAAAFSSSNF
jgi:hypothetical protein